MIETYCPSVETFIASAKAYGEVRFFLVFGFLTLLLFIGPVIGWISRRDNAPSNGVLIAGCVWCVCVCVVAVGGVVNAPEWFDSYYYPQAKVFAEEGPPCLKTEAINERDARIRALELGLLEVRQERDKLRAWADGVPVALLPDWVPKKPKKRAESEP